jgi:hypothetical protein
VRPGARSMSESIPWGPCFNAPLIRRHSGRLLANSDLRKVDALNQRAIVLEVDL